MKTACIMVCKLRDGVCVGCHRTIKEISETSANLKRFSEEVQKLFNAYRDYDNDEFQNKCE